MGKHRIGNVEIMLPYDVGQEVYVASKDGVDKGVMKGFMVDNEKMEVTIILTDESQHSWENVFNTMIEAIEKYEKITGKKVLKIRKEYE